MVRDATTVQRRCGFRVARTKVHVQARVDPQAVVLRKTIAVRRVKNALGICAGPLERKARA